MTFINRQEMEWEKLGVEEPSTTRYGQWKSEKTPVPEKNYVRSWVLTSNPPLFSVRAELLFHGRVMAWGERKFARQPENS